MIKYVLLTQQRMVFQPQTITLQILRQELKYTRLETLQDIQHRPINNSIWELVSMSILVVRICIFKIKF